MTAWILARLKERRFTPSAEGEVVYSNQLRGYGNMVIVRHAGGIVSVYAHNQPNLVHEGQKVERGEVIAKVGSTGRVTGPHLHFEIRKNNAAQDPLLYLPQLCCLPASDNVAPKECRESYRMKLLTRIRNDVVGSLLRPAKLKEARARYDEGLISIEQFRSLEDQRSATRSRSRKSSDWRSSPTVSTGV